MNRFIIPLIATCSLTPTLFGLVNLGEGRVDLNVQASVYHDTAINGRSTSDEDFVVSFRPSLQYVRNSRNLDLAVSVGIDGRFYLDNNQYDETDVFFDLKISPSAQMQTSRFLFTGDLLLNTETKTDDAIGEIVSIRNYGASVRLVYDPNRHYTVIGSLAYRNRDPDLDTYYDTEIVDASVDLQVPVRENLNLTMGIGCRDTASDGPTTDSETLTYSAGISGNILPRLSGSLSLGVQDRSFDSSLLDDATNPYLSANLSWQVDESSKIDLSGSMGFGTTIDDRSSENSSIRLTATRKMSRDLSGVIYISYERDQYSSVILPDRDDKETAVGATLTYQLVRYGSIALDLRYSDQSSNIALYDFDRLRVGIRFNGSW